MSDPRTFGRRTALAAFAALAATGAAARERSVGSHAASSAGAVVRPAARHGGHRPLTAPAIRRAAAPPRPLVMVDPGHGGKDPGAIGWAGTYEKHIAIAAATELRDRINAGGRQRCVLTRDDDRFIPLADRVAIAEAHGAALFMSVHADSLGTNHVVRGASVYTLSAGASDPLTASLARRENSADRFAGPRDRGALPAVQRILADLVADATRTGSTRMAGGVVGALAAHVSLLPNPSRHADFAVLQSRSIPSVLVEMGFMSNAADEQLLRTRAHRDQITLALAQAVDRHFAAGESVTRLAG